MTGLLERNERKVTKVASLLLITSLTFSPSQPNTLTHTHAHIYTHSHSYTHTTYSANACSYPGKSDVTLALVKWRVVNDTRSQSFFFRGLCTMAQNNQKLGRKYRATHLSLVCSHRPVICLLWLLCLHTLLGQTKALFTHGTVE